MDLVLPGGQAEAFMVNDKKSGAGHKAAVLDPMDDRLRIQRIRRIPGPERPDDLQALAPA